MNKKRLVVWLLLWPILIPLCLMLGILILFTIIIDGVEYALTGKVTEDDGW
jgi:hypothetical protein